MNLDVQKHIKDLYLEGKTYNEIAKTLDIPKGTVANFITEGNFKNRKARLTEEEIDKIIDLHLNGHARNAIAGIMGKAFNTVDRVVSNYKIEEAQKQVKLQMQSNLALHDAIEIIRGSEK